MVEGEADMMIEIEGDLHEMKEMEGADLADTEMEGTETEEDLAEIGGGRLRNSSGRPRQRRPPLGLGSSCCQGPREAQQPRKQHRIQREFSEELNPGKPGRKTSLLQNLECKNNLEIIYKNFYTVIFDPTALDSLIKGGL